MTASGDDARVARPTRRAVVSGFGAGGAALAAGCSGLGNLGEPLPGGAKPQPEPDAATTAGLPPAAGAEPGKTKIGLVLPLSASGNAGAAAQAMRNAA